MNPPLKYPPKRLRASFMPRGEIEPGQRVNQEKTRKLKTEARERKRHDDDGRWCEVKKVFYRPLFLSGGVEMKR